jgi:hypothetical protein
LTVQQSALDQPSLAIWCCLSVLTVDPDSEMASGNMIHLLVASSRGRQIFLRDRNPSGSSKDEACSRHAQSGHGVARGGWGVSQGPHATGRLQLPGHWPARPSPRCSALSAARHHSYAARVSSLAQRFSAQLASSTIAFPYRPSSYPSRGAPSTQSMPVDRRLLRIISI